MCNDNNNKNLLNKTNKTHTFSKLDHADAFLPLWIKIKKTQKII